MTMTGPAQARAGTQVIYTIEVLNAGPSDSQMVVVDDRARPGLSFVSAGAPCAGGFPCALGSIAAGASQSVTATFAIAPKVYPARSDREHCDGNRHHPGSGFLEQY